MAIPLEPGPIRFIEPDQIPPEGIASTFEPLAAAAAVQFGGQGAAIAHAHAVMGSDLSAGGGAAEAGALIDRAASEHARQVGAGAEVLTFESAALDGIGFDLEDWAFDLPTVPGQPGPDVPNTPVLRLPHDQPESGGGASGGGDQGGGGGGGGGDEGGGGGGGGGGGDQGGGGGGGEPPPDRPPDRPPRDREPPGKQV